MPQGGGGFNLAVLDPVVFVGGPAASVLRGLVECSFDLGVEASQVEEGGLKQFVLFRSAIALGLVLEHLEGIEH